MIGMYAVFRSGGKQYRASTGDVLRLEKIEAKEGAGVEFDQVLQPFSRRRSGQRQSFAAG